MSIVLLLVAGGTKGELVMSQGVTFSGVNEWMRDLPWPALRTVAIGRWMSRFLESYEAFGAAPRDLRGFEESVYMPSPEALINLNTNQPVRLVTEPSAGDFRWSYQTAEEPGRPAYHMVTLSFFYAPGGEGTELKVREEFMAEGSGNYQSNWWNGVKGWVEGLTDREKRLFWLCGLLDIHLIEAGQFLGLRDRFFRRFQDYQIIDWWLPPSVLKNLWTGEPMRAVPFDQPSPGNFTYGHHLAEDGEPFVLSPRCYGENGRVIYTWYDKAKMEMDRVSREAGYDYTRYSDS